MLLTMTMLLHVSDLSNTKYDDTSLDNSTKLKFGTVGNSFQRSPRLGKLLEVAAFLQIQLSISMLKCQNKRPKDQKISKASKLRFGAPPGCPTLRYHPGDHGVQRLLLKWPSTTMACHRSTSIPVYAVYRSVYICAPNVISMISLQGGEPSTLQAALP